MHDLAIFDVKKLKKAAKKASDKAVAQATKFLRKEAHDIVGKRSGQKKKYDLRVWLTHGTTRKQVGNEAGDPKTFRYPRTLPGQGETMKDFMKRREVKKGWIVQRSLKGKFYTKDPQKQGTYLAKTPSQAGRPPNSHKASQPGWQHHWLRKSIQCDPPKNGVVYVNPHPPGKKKSSLPFMPSVLENGGKTVSRIRKFAGYTVNTYHFKNGNITYAFRKVFTEDTKSYRLKPRPFLKPALAKAADKLLEILKGSIK